VASAEPQYYEWACKRYSVFWNDLCQVWMRTVHTVWSIPIRRCSRDQIAAVNIVAFRLVALTSQLLRCHVAVNRRDVDVRFGVAGVSQSSFLHSTLSSRQYVSIPREGVGQHPPGNGTHLPAPRHIQQDMPS